MNIEELKGILEADLIPKRFIHSLNVANTAAKLSSRYGQDGGKAVVAGLLHDYARDVRNWDMVPLCEQYGVQTDEITRSQPELLHGPLAAAIVHEKFGIDDPDILNAIHYHTTGRGNMSTLEKIIFISDYIEPGRIFPGVDEIRKVAFSDIDAAIIIALDSTIKYVIKKGALIQPDSIEARNFIIAGKRIAPGNNQSIPGQPQTNYRNHQYQNQQYQSQQYPAQQYPAQQHQGRRYQAHQHQNRQFQNHQFQSQY